MLDVFRDLLQTVIVGTSFITCRELSYTLLTVLFHPFQELFDVCVEATSERNLQNGSFRVERLSVSKETKFAEDLFELGEEIKDLTLLSINPFRNDCLEVHSPSFIHKRVEDRGKQPNLWPVGGEGRRELNDELELGGLVDTLFDE